MPTITYPDLPVSERRDEMAKAIAEHQVVVVAGETGSGKTTQLPKICLELGRGIRGTIGHTQPRRLAARTVAQRIADELGTPLGEAVGYTVRFTDQASDRTLVKLMTDGILLAEIQRDRRLLRYDTLILDEAHERSLNIDFLLGYLRELLPRRPDLKVIVTSATIEPERFAAHFGDEAPIVEVSGRRTRSKSVTARWKSWSRPATTDDPDDPDHEVVRTELRDPTDAIVDAVTSSRPSRQATCWCSCPASARSGTPQRYCAAPEEHRGAPALRPAADRRTAEDLPAEPDQPPDRAGHQRRRDIADRARDPLRRRPRNRPHLALQPPDQGAAPADRADLAGVRPAAGRPLGAHRARRVHPALLRSRLRHRGRATPTQKSCAPTSPR